MGRLAGNGPYTRPLLGGNAAGTALCVSAGPFVQSDIMRDAVKRWRQMQSDEDREGTSSESPAEEQEIARDRTYKIIGAAMHVHTDLGFGFAEPVYQHALAVEFAHQSILFDREHELSISYRGVRLPVSYRADFLCFGSVIVELKAAASLADRDRSQVMNYLKATGLARGLLLNFGSERLEYRRVLWAPNLPSSVSSVEEEKEG